MTPKITAILAEDEPLLARALKKRLSEQWPELVIVGESTDGLSATAMALQDLPDVLFLDIRLPGRSGLEVAEAIVDEWPQDRPAPLIVFVTAFEEFAMDAFECDAVDFLQKPVTRDRLAKTVARLKARLAQRAPTLPVNGIEALLKSISALGASPVPVPLRLLETLHVGIGNIVRIIPVHEVLYFEAADKYVNVVTADGEGLVRLCMRDLLSQIDPSMFMQVHRAIVVNRKAIAAAIRNDSGRVVLQLRGSGKMVPVSRAFAYLFRAM